MRSVSACNYLHISKTSIYLVVTGNVVSAVRGKAIGDSTENGSRRNHILCRKSLK